jgi:predicted ester cyclase
MSYHPRSVVIRWFEEVWNQNRSETIEELMAPECVIHDGSEDIHGPEGFRAFQSALRAIFADIRVQTHDVISDGDLTCLRWSSTMRHIPTGKRLHTTGMSLIRFHDGQFIEAWQNWDRYGLMQQIPSAFASAAGAP